VLRNGSMRLPTLTGEEARAAAERAARRLAADARVRLVYLYGSAADASRPTARDVDLAVVCRPRLGLDDLMHLRADVVAAAGAPVDLIALDDAGVVLTWEVTETGRCLFARDPDDEVAFVTRARARYWDFKPFLEEQWRLAGERLAERRRGLET
jgi:predicted nucleotidyltransferase